jgi:hypothetical protein
MSFDNPFDFLGGLMYSQLGVILATTVPPNEDDLQPTFRFDFTNSQLLLFLGATVGITFVFVWALLKAAQFVPQVGLVLSLSVLSLVSILAAVAIRDSEFITLAATGIGALAGAVSATYQALRYAQDAERRERREIRELEVEHAGEGLPSPTDPED